MRGVIKYPMKKLLIDFEPTSEQYLAIQMMLSDTSVTSPSERKILAFIREAAEKALVASDFLNPIVEIYQDDYEEPT